MYPNYKEQAITRLVELFAHLAGRQFKNILFDEDGDVDLGNETVFPLVFSTRDVINISKLAEDIVLPSDKETCKWIRTNQEVIRGLAQKAEQHEYDDPLHLLHVMMNINCVCGQYDMGDLRAVKEEDGIKVFLAEEFSGAHMLKAAESVNVIYEDQWEQFKIMEVKAQYIEEENDWRLTFKAIRLSNGEEMELKNEQVSPNDKKHIADWIIDEARREPNHISPLEKISANMWRAPRCGAAEVNGVTVPTALNEIVNCNILTVEAGTNGKQGGDSGQGGRTYLRIRNDANTDLSCRTTVHHITTEANGKCHHNDDVTDHGHVDEIEIMLGGDSELDTFIDALEFAADVLRKKRDHRLLLLSPEQEEK